MTKIIKIYPSDTESEIINQPITLDKAIQYGIVKPIENIFNSYQSNHYLYLDKIFSARPNQNDINLFNTRGKLKNKYSKINKNSLYFAVNNFFININDPIAKTIAKFNILINNPALFSIHLRYALE